MKYVDEESSNFQDTPGLVHACSEQAGAASDLPGKMLDMY